MPMPCDDPFAVVVSWREAQNGVVPQVDAYLNQETPVPPELARRQTTLDDKRHTRSWRLTDPLRAGLVVLARWSGC